LCGKDLPLDVTLSSIVGDNIFPGLCSICAKEAANIYNNYLKNNSRLARNSWQQQLESLRDYHYQEILGPAINAFAMKKRRWHKLNRAKKVYEKK
jgi:hypothetical protein